LLRICELVFEGCDAFVSFAKLELNLGDLDEESFVLCRRGFEVCLTGLELIEEGGFLSGEIGDGGLSGGESSFEGLEFFGVSGLKNRTRRKHWRSVDASFRFHLVSRSIQRV